MCNGFIELTIDEASILDGGCWFCRIGGAIAGAQLGSAFGVPGTIAGGIVGLWIAW